MKKRARGAWILLFGGESTVGRPRSAFRVVPMLGKQANDSDLFQCVTMEALVPADHVLRRLRAALDLGFVRSKVADLYSRVGRPSVDPEVVVRIWVLQQFYGFSERQICDEVTMHAGFRWFCGLSFNDPVPDQSTLVKLRTEKWAGTDLWQEVLDATVRACEAAGLCRPRHEQRFGVDGTQIRANAAVASIAALPPTLTVVEEGPEGVADAPDGGGSDARPGLEEPEPARAGGARHSQPAGPPSEPDAGSPETEPRGSCPPVLRMEEGGRPEGARQSGDPDWHGEHFSNATHRSRTDPEARLYRKGRGQEAALRYLGHYLADVRSRVIYDAVATQATGTAEREAALTMLQRLQTVPTETAFDLGYRDGEFLADVLGLGCIPMVPLQDERLEPEPTWVRGTKNPERQAQRGRQLAVARARNRVRLAARSRRGATAQRQRSRLEHLFAEAKEHHGLARAHGRGCKRLDHQIKLTASVQNLKRLMRADSRRRAAQRVALPAAQRAAVRWNYGWRLTAGHRLRRRADLLCNTGAATSQAVARPQRP
jgi:transposase